MNDTTATSAYVTVSEFAKRVGVSPNHALAECQRGHIDSVMVGRRRLIPWPAWQLRALGVTDLPKFVRDLGIRNLDELVAFLGGERGEAS